MEPPRVEAGHGRHRGPRDPQDAFEEFDANDARLSARITQFYGDDDAAQTNDLYMASSTAWRSTTQ